ncbi:MAG TPA: type III pantothenate kinase [Longimicrobiales bacterium]|nr:type III pantothenate kinase [Longimicrobiales bacterium]
MIVVFDIGNTEIVMGLFEEHELLDHWRIATYPERTVDEFGLLVRALIRESGFDADVIRAAVIGSVVPQMTAIAVETCERHLGSRVVIIDATTSLPIRLDVDEPLSVGADRILNTLAATQLFRRDTIVVDLGTATTFDCISRDGVFIGGIIAPGVRTGAETLVRRTAKLPRVDLEPPTTVIGRRTETSLRSGIFFGAVDAIDGIVRRIKEEWRRPDALVVATGGLAPMLAPHTTTVDRVEPFITLFGLDLAFKVIEEAEAAAPRPPGKRRR